MGISVKRQRLRCAVSLCAEKEWYFSIEPHRDVIEEPIHDMLDISGWELRKALRLFKNQIRLFWNGSLLR